MNDEIQNFKRRSRERIDSIGWGLFLVMLGIIWIVPDGLLPNGSFLIGTGIILLGLNYYRQKQGFKASKFGLFLGLVALLAGLSNYLGLQISIFPIILILWGISIIWKIISKRSNKEEERQYFE